MSKRDDVVFKFLESMDDAGHSPPLSPENGRQARVVPDKPRDPTADLQALGKGRMTENGVSFPTLNPLGERTGLGVKSIQVIQLTDIWPRTEEVALEAHPWNGVEITTPPLPRPRQGPVRAGENLRAEKVAAQL